MGGGGGVRGACCVNSLKQSRVMVIENWMRIVRVVHHAASTAGQRVANLLLSTIFRAPAPAPALTYLVASRRLVAAVRSAAVHVSAAILRVAIGW